MVIVTSSVNDCNIYLRAQRYTPFNLYTTTITNTSLLPFIDSIFLYHHNLAFFLPCHSYSLWWVPYNAASFSLLRWLEPWTKLIYIFVEFNLKTRTYMIYNAQIFYSFIMWDGCDRVKSHDWTYRMHKLNYLNYPYFQFIFFHIQEFLIDSFLFLFLHLRNWFILPLPCGKLPMLCLYGRIYFEATNISVSSPIQLLAHLHLQNICVKYSTEWAWMTRYSQAAPLKLYSATWFWIF